MPEYISRSEAKIKKLPRFYTGPCVHGHDVEKYTANGNCVECIRERGEKGGKHHRPSKQMQLDDALMRPQFAEPIKNRVVLSGEEQTKALEAFALLGNEEDAADALGLSIKAFRARRAANTAFDATLTALEKSAARGNLKPTGSAFDWTAENRGKLIDKFVDTGDIAEARDSIGVVPSEYQRELARNPEFALMVHEAEPKAQKHLEERAIQLALRGNDKVLVAVLKAKNPEYRDRVELNVNQTVRLSDDQLRAKIGKLQKRLGLVNTDDAIDAEFTEGPRRLSASVGGTGAADPVQSLPDALPGDREASTRELSEALGIL